MPVEAAHSLERSENLLDAFDHVRSRDEAEIGGADGREKLEPDVGRRCSKSNRRLRILLEVVRSEPLRLLRHELLEVGPVQLRVAKRCLTFRFCEVYLTENRRRAQRERDARARKPDQYQWQCPHYEQESFSRAGPGTNG